MLSTNARNAYHKAIERNGAALVRRLEHGVYELPSATRNGQTYLVTGAAADGSDHLCDCEAGRRGLMCWHVASVVLRRTQETAKAQARKLAHVPAPALRRPLQRVALV